MGRRLRPQEIHHGYNSLSNLITCIKVVEVEAL
ncbi:unnamed protein product [Linum tenue]|uniref:Uncharacterized protein n=1 Tax=Linum tenue TaxID=586396 RepID=A0AAV0H6X7_9ROSI|nr:unnamed protein product [Linum tenue]